MHRFSNKPYKLWGIIAISIIWLCFYLYVSSNNISDEEYRAAKERNAITIHCNKGRLGNQICLYAVLYGLSELNHRNMSLMPCNFYKLQPYFDIKADVVNMGLFREQNPHKIGSFLRHNDTAIKRDTTIIKGHLYPCSFTFFNHIKDKLTEALTFRPDILNYAAQALTKAKGNRTFVTFVGIHVRRTDYSRTVKGSWLKAFQGSEVDMEYFQKATQYFSNKYPNTFFVAVSDDRGWCKKHLKELGVHVMPEVPSPAHDMAILSLCNHTIMTYGTFGFWGAYLAGGEVVYFDKFLKPDTDFMKNKFQFENMYLPEWIGITTNSSYV